jgi:hypothetical protein
MSERTASQRIRASNGGLVPGVAWRGTSRVMHEESRAQGGHAGARASSQSRGGCTGRKGSGGLQPGPDGQRA